MRVSLNSPVVCQGRDEEKGWEQGGKEGGGEGGAINKGIRYMLLWSITHAITIIINEDTPYKSMHAIITFPSLWNSCVSPGAKAVNGIDERISCAMVSRRSVQRGKRLKHIDVYLHLSYIIILHVSMNGLQRLYSIAAYTISYCKSKFSQPITWIQLFVIARI